MTLGRIHPYLLGVGLAAGLAAAAGVVVSAQTGDAHSRALLERTSCATNMKQLSLGLMMYAQDYDATFPPASRWGKAILPYVKNNAVYVCPTDAAANNLNGTRRNSYAINRNISARPFKSIPKPALFPTLFEAGAHRPNAVGLAANVINPPRHEGGNNFAYADGRVKWEQKTPGFGAPYIRRRR